MKNRGITLIALVITIVVLIILAAVAINLSLGNNGIFNRAKTGKELYQNAEEYERDHIAQTSDEIDGYVEGDRDKFYITKTELLKIPVSVAATSTEIDRNIDIHLEDSIENYDAVIFRCDVYYNGNFQTQKSYFHILDNIKYNNTNTRNLTLGANIYIQAYAVWPQSGPWLYTWLKDAQTLHVEKTYANASNCTIKITRIIGIKMN